MRTRVLAVLIVLEATILFAIVSSSLQLSQEITRSSSAQRLVHAVVRTTQQVAARIAQVTLD